MAFKTWTAGETLTASDVNTYLGKQAVIVCTSGTRPGSPVEGQTVYETDTDKLLTYDGATWNLPKNVAGGTLGYAQVVADQTGIGTSVTDLTGLSVPVTVGAGRRLRIWGQALWSSSNEVNARVQEGGTSLGRIIQNTPGAAGHLKGFVIVTPSAGAHTYKLTANSNVGTVDMLAGADYPASVLVEDIGGV